MQAVHVNMFGAQLSRQCRYAHLSLYDRQPVMANPKQACAPTPLSLPLHRGLRLPQVSIIASLNSGFTGLGSSSAF